MVLKEKILNLLFDAKARRNSSRYYIRERNENEIKNEAYDCDALV